MLTIVGILLVLVLVAFSAYSGAREGAFYGTYVLTRTLIGFLVALTFCEPLAILITNLLDAGYPAYDYFLLTSFALLFAATTTLIRQFKVRATSPSVPCIGLFDAIYGAAAGFANGVLLSGVVLITLSLIPALPYMSPSISRFEMDGKNLDAGGPALKFYDYMSARFGGNAAFPLQTDEPLADEDGQPLPEGEDINMNGEYDYPGLEAYIDINGNGQWDRSWMGRYRTCWQFGTVEAARADYPLLPAAPEEE
jgi:hypothetical protein